ncbi:hypothetical protein L3Q65_18245 [Amycolatopsis sp. FU40]|uniref:hypothetical protein n=1 Tax=Amycolatopsis sp. FU40 TaxID=2914159 RepID=UPI001F206C82|nr:hypothetical protein [Amycolatopsis sp. FU40]UKD58578.1 hypothetical protein L3Q65_18245 [Amycolatopsis sp. FU40]
MSRAVVATALAQDWFGDPMLALCLVIFVIGWQLMPFRALPQLRYTILKSSMLMLVGSPTHSDLVLALNGGSGDAPHFPASGPVTVRFPPATTWAGRAPWRCCCRRSSAVPGLSLPLGGLSAGPGK